MSEFCPSTANPETITKLKKLGIEEPFDFTSIYKHWLFRGRSLKLEAKLSKPVPYFSVEIMGDRGNIEYIAGSEEQLPNQAECLARLLIKEAVDRGLKI